MTTYDLSRAAWRTSSYSGPNGSCVEVAPIPGPSTWRKSSYSGANGACVEVALAAGSVAVRDSKNREGGALVFGASAWRALVAEAKANALDPRGNA